jgi:hypothetical protein
MPGFALDRYFRVSRYAQSGGASSIAPLLRVRMLTLSTVAPSRRGDTGAQCVKNLEIAKSDGSSRLSPKTSSALPPVRRLENISWLGNRHHEEGDDVFRQRVIEPVSLQKAISK